MNKELYFDEDEITYSSEDFNGQNDVLDVLMDSQISESRFAEIIEEFEVANDFYDNEEANDIGIDSLDSDSFDSLDLH
ncbi:MAG: hypothetical protein WAU15_08335 [Nitrosomonas sp.]|jgi:hypothetical protein